MTSQRATPEQRRERAELDARAGFGKVGISAVAAAMRYQSEPKNTNYAPVKLRFLEESDEAAA